MISSLPLFLALILTPEAPLAPRYTVLADTPAAFEVQDPQYIDCVRLITEDLDIGRTAAQQWALEGGGAPAQHCLAIADIAAGYPKLGAVRLTELANRADAGDDQTRAIIFASAALAWLDANATDEASKAVGAALAKAPEFVELQIIAAKVYAAENRWQAAADAVTNAEEQGLNTAEAHIIRARALRALAKDQEAAEDVAAALKLEPFNVDALVLRGELAQSGIEIKTRYQPIDETN